jgi:sugar phosphate isomerase/epimerase
LELWLDTFSHLIALAAGRYDVARELDRLVALGLRGIQINVNGPNGRFLGGPIDDDAQVRRVREALEERQLGVEVAGYSTRLTELEPQLRLTAALGATTLRTLLVFEADREATFEATRRDMAAVLPLARELGVRIALENHEEVSSEELRALVAGIDDPTLGVCLDAGNDLVLYDDPVEGAELLAPYALTTHVKDQKLVRVDGTVYSVGVPLGEGDIDLSGVIAAVQRGSTLDHITLQDTWGYSTRLNPFGRRDVGSEPAYDGIPEFATREEAATAGYLLDLDGLSPEELDALWQRQQRHLERDVAYARALLAAD